MAETKDALPETTSPEAAAIDQAFESAPSAGDEGDLRAEVARLQADLQEANDRALRTHAELENFRKRSRREMEDERRYAALPIMRDVLNVCDNLDRAIEAAEKNTAGSGLLEGVKMVSLQLTTYLEQHLCRRIAAVGEPFDPHRHEAISQESSNEYPPGVVTRLTRHGYQLHDRVIRPAQVMVSTGAPQLAATATAAETEK